MTLLDRLRATGRPPRVTGHVDGGARDAGPRQAADVDALANAWLRAHPRRGFDPDNIIRVSAWPGRRHPNHGESPHE
jgi:hypothetical protein